MIEPLCAGFSISSQCELLSLNRSSFYYITSGESQENLAIMRYLDEQYFSTPFYDALKLLKKLKLLDFNVNIKRVRRLMKMVNCQAIYREPHTTVMDKMHYKYLYLLRGLIKRYNQV